MTSSDILDVFNDCIERLHAGESIGDCLRAHPQHADTLRPLLETAHRVRLASPAVPADARARVRERVLRATPPRRKRWAFAPRDLVLAAASVLVIGFIAALALTGRDGGPSAQVEPLPSPSGTPTAVETPTATLTQTPSPTATPTVTPTVTATATPSTTPTSSASPTPLPCTFEVTSVSVNLRSGPGTGYAIVGSTASGDTLSVIARHTSGDWLQVQVAERDAWIAASLGTLRGACDALPVSTLPLNMSPDSGSLPPEDDGAGDGDDTPDEGDDDGLDDTPDDDGSGGGDDAPDDDSDEDDGDD